MTGLVCVNDYEEYAKEHLPKVYFDFYISGAGQQRTLEWNKTSYSNSVVSGILVAMPMKAEITISDILCCVGERVPPIKESEEDLKEMFRIRPKYMRKISKRTTATTILGKPVSFPIGISPTAFHKLAHHEGECATSKAAEELETIFILSSHANSTLQEIATAAPNGRKWMQLYIFRSREMTEDFVGKAERFGFEALVITVDFALFGLRFANIKNKFDLPPNVTSVNLDEYKKKKYIENYVELANPDADWGFIKWLKTITKLPIIIKGILTAEDAISAVDAGASGILVSNHGARQLDSLPSTIEVLSEVVGAVGDRVEVYLDGGIRDGTDVFKALGLGAKMVFIGRPAIWGLAHDGKEGVKNVLKILKNELDNAMGITGCSTLNDITRNMVVHESYYSKY